MSLTSAILDYCVSIGINGQLVDIDLAKRVTYRYFLSSFTWIHRRKKSSLIYSPSVRLDRNVSFTVTMHRENSQSAGHESANR